MTYGSESECATHYTTAPHYIKENTLKCKKRTTKPVGTRGMNRNNFVVIASGFLSVFFTLERVLFYVVLACHSECECKSNCQLDRRHQTQQRTLNVRDLHSLTLAVRKRPYRLIVCFSPLNIYADLCSVVA